MAGLSPSDGLSTRVKFYMKVSKTLTEEEVKQLRETLVIENHLGKARVAENATAEEMFGALEADNKIGEGNMKILADLLRGLGKEKLAQEAEKVAKRGSSVAVHSNLGTSNYIKIFSLIVLLCGVVCGVYLQVLSQDIQRLRDEMKQLKEEMAEIEKLKPEIQQQQDDLKRLNGEDATKDNRIQKLERRNYIERCETGVIKLEGESMPRPKRDGSIRERKKDERFSRPFNKVPVVTIGMTQLDHPGDTRVNITIVNSKTSETGLTVCFATWNDSDLYSATVYWMACA